jgi:hypothetical protein
MASAQLQLITTEPTWKLDKHTVEVGRAGVARARAALAAAIDADDTPSVLPLGPDGHLFEHHIGRAA